jgi:hypothetical protein
VIVPSLAFFFPFSFMPVTFLHLVSTSDLKILLSRPRLWVCKPGLAGDFSFVIQLVHVTSSIKVQVLACTHGTAIYSLRLIQTA